MIVAVPSKGRAGKGKTIDYLKGRCVVYVPTVEADAYQKTYPATTVVGVPMTVRGITATRNWILDNTDDRHVVFVDDDLMRAGWQEIADENMLWRDMTVEEWEREWAVLFGITEQMQYRIWGVATTTEPRAVRPWTPFIWHTYVTASCMGILNDGRTRFDPEFTVKEDYELCLRCIKEDGGVVGARYLGWQNYHWEDAGGCRDYRTGEMEDRLIRKLVTMYPGMIRRVSKGGSSWSVDLTF